MELMFIAVNIAVLAAAALQAATGIGFGIIAGPILLVVLNDGAAIQISILLNLIIAGMLTPLLWRNVDRMLLTRLVAGLIVASPIGVWLFLSMNITWLKLLAAAAVLLTLVLTIRNHQRQRPAEPVPSSVAQQGSMGFIAGLMGGSLGIPGPVPAAWMSAKGYSKDTIRATILAMFVVSYTLALLLQIGMVTIATETYISAANLAPATIIGIVSGRWLSNYLTEETFRKILLIVLGATVILLLWTLL